MSINNEFTENNKVHFMNVLTDSLELTQDDKIRIINILSTDLNLKPLREVGKEVGKSYNGLKNYGNPVIIAGKYFGVSKL